MATILLSWEFPGMKSVNLADELNYGMLLARCFNY